MTINVDGLNINYKISYRGEMAEGSLESKDKEVTFKEDEEVAVILEGWGTNIPVYDSVAATINTKMKVLLFDLPGFGESDEPKEAWSVDDYSDFFIKLLDALGIKKCTLIGHSYGGRMIIKLAARESIPFEIKRIVLIDSAGIMPKRSFKQKMKVKRYKLLKKILLSKPIHAMFRNIIDDWAKNQGSADYRNASPMMKKCMVKAVNEDLTDCLPKIRQETLLIWGDKDTATPISDAKLMEEKIPSSGLAVIPGTGHYSFLENPGLFKSIMQSYFEIK